MEFTFSSTTTSTSTVVAFSGQITAGGEILLDDVSVTASSIAEPSSLQLLGSGKLGMSATRACGQFADPLSFQSRVSGDYMTNAENISLIRRFVAVCVRANPDEFADYFTEDATWWNAPWQPIRGIQDIKETFRRGAGEMKALPWEIRNIVAERDLVMTERVDHFMVGDKTVSVPCMGVFELRNGKIAAWRDYWDLRQFEAQVQGSA